MDGAGCDLARNKTQFEVRGTWARLPYTQVPRGNFLTFIGLNILIRKNSGSDDGFARSLGLPVRDVQRPGEWGCSYCPSCSCKSLLTHIPVSYPDKTHGLTKLDFGGVYILLS